MGTQHKSRGWHQTAESMCSSLAVSLKNVLEKAKIINFIKSQPLSAHVFDILYELYTHEALHDIHKFNKEKASV